jgi:hypothetical protein
MRWACGANPRCRRCSTSTRRPTTREADSEPVGVTFNGTRRDLTHDIVAAMGAAARVRSGAEAFRQASVTSSAQDGVSNDQAEVDRFRRAWTTFFETATDGREAETIASAELEVRCEVRSRMEFTFRFRIRF